jgi:hypothetical protein
MALNTLRVLIIAKGHSAKIAMLNLLGMTA